MRTSHQRAAHARDMQILAIYREAAEKGQPALSYYVMSRLLNVYQDTFESSLIRLRRKGLIKTEMVHRGGSRQYRVIIGAVATDWSVPTQAKADGNRADEEVEPDDPVVMRSCLANAVPGCRRQVAGTKRTILRICDRCSGSENFTPYLAAMGNCGHRAFTPGSRSGG